MNTDNLKFFATGGAQGIQPGSFWTAFMNLLTLNGSPRVHFQRLRELRGRADRENLIWLNEVIPGLDHIVDQLLTGQMTEDQAFNILEPYLLLMPYLLSQFPPYQKILKAAAYEAVRESTLRDPVRLIIDMAQSPDGSAEHWITKARVFYPAMQDDVRIVILPDKPPSEITIPLGALGVRHITIPIQRLGDWAIGYSAEENVLIIYPYL